jgi:hypothetical protein
MTATGKACPFVEGRVCLQEDCMAWLEGGCCLIRPGGSSSAFEQKLKAAAPLMYRSLLDLVRIMEETSKDCNKCGPELWNYAQETRASLLDELIRSELAGAGIKGGCD